MAQMTMYPVKDGSPQTTTTALLSETATEVSVAELSCFPAVGAEGGNLLTLWNDTLFETCEYTAKSSASGTGTLTIVRSGARHSSTSGGGIEWPAGTKCARTGTGYDFTAYKNNIEDLDTRLDTAEGEIDALQTAPPAHKTIHQSGGTDAIKLDDLAAPDDNTDLDVSASAHGLCPKLPDDASKFLDGSGNFRQVTSDDAGAASSTTATQNIYVDKAATGTGDGTSWTNAFTTVQAAINSLPAIINHAVTIIIRKGSTPYAENVTVQRVVAGGSITIRGEYYWYGTVAASKTGKITLGVSDYGYANRAQIEAGDVIWATKWSGAVGASAPTESIIDTVSSVSGAEVSLTTNTGKTFDTSWTYRIVKTIITGTITPNCNCYIGGVAIDGTGASAGASAAIYQTVSGTTVTVSYCYITGSQKRGISTNAQTIISDCAIKLTGGAEGCINAEGAVFTYARCVFSGTVGIRAASSFAVWNIYNHIMSGTGTGILAFGNSYVKSAAGRNDATTPMNPASSSESAYISQG